MAEMTIKAESGHFSGDDLERMVEAILFAASDPMSKTEIASRLPVDADVTALIGALVERYSHRGVNLVRAGRGWAFRTSPEYGFLMSVEKVIPRKLSRAALETLAIIAYHQPVTRAEIEEVRGVGMSRGTINILIECNWVCFGKRRNAPGRPVTYMVTEHFLDHFGLASVSDLPDLEEMRNAGLLEPVNPESRTSG